MKYLKLPALCYISLMLIGCATMQSSSTIKPLQELYNTTLNVLQQYGKHPQVHRLMIERKTSNSIATNWFSIRKGETSIKIVVSFAGDKAMVKVEEKTNWSTIKTPSGSNKVYIKKYIQDQISKAMPRYEEY
jgi:hypothetical protein